MIRDEKKKDGPVAGLSADIYRVPATLQRLGHGGKSLQQQPRQQTVSWVRRMFGRDAVNAGG